MAMYALSVKPLICQLKQDVPEVKQLWYADEATGTGSCSKLRLFWDRLGDLGMCMATTQILPKPILL